MDFKLGDKVRFLNEVGEGKVLKILSSSSYLIETEDGFDQTYNANELVAVKNSSDYKIDGVLFNESVQDKINSEDKANDEAYLKQKFRHLHNYSSEDELVIDLHIEELIDSHKGLSNSQILNIQLTNFKRELNVAIRRKASKLIVIHGVGEGVLKAEIRKELYDHFPEYDYHDASYKEYGYGATEVVLR